MNWQGWAIARSDHELSEEVPASPGDVRAFYADLTNLVSVHPLVVSVRVVERSDTADGRRHAYRVTDRLPLGPFILPIRYRASVTVVATGDVFAEARQFPWVSLTTAVAFAAAGAGTRVTERITIAAPRPLAAITTREAVKAHREMLAGIRRRFHGQPAGRS